jgi:hypothetical protein
MRLPAYREVQALPRARDRHVHEAPLLLDAAVLQHAVVVREEAFLEPEMKTARIPGPFAECTVISCSASWPAEASCSPASRLAWREEAMSTCCSGVASRHSDDDILLRLARGLDAVLEVLGEEGRRVDELVQVLEPVLAVLLGGVVGVQLGSRSRISSISSGSAASRRTCEALDHLHELARAPCRCAR